ncbi:MAG: DMT family transporter [Azospira sp.]|jgi:S-adenosylmethionine uptake transporter|nr:DMT family transporter [Azospira sp.]
MQALWMLLASFLFAAMGVCVKLAAGIFSAPEIVFYRSLIALVLMLALMRLRGVGLASPHLRHQVFRGISGFVSLLMYFYAIAMLPLATAVTLNYTSPLFLAVYFAAFSGMRLSRGVVVALVIGFAGVVLLLRPTLAADQLLGGLIALGSGIISGLAYFNVRELGARGEPETRTVFYFSLIASICSGLWMLAYEFQPVGLRGGLLLLGVGVFATLAQLCMTRAYARGRPIVAASLAYTTIVFASLFGAVLWGETMSAGAWFGIALIVASGIAATRVSRANPAEQD